LLVAFAQHIALVAAFLPAAPISLDVHLLGVAAAACWKVTTSVVTIAARSVFMASSLR
jgi:hypothetical protein